MINSRKLKVPIQKLHILQLKTLVTGIRGIIPGEISVDDFSAVTDIDNLTAKKVLEELIKNNIGKKENGSFIFTSADRLRVALHALEKGALIDQVSENLDWRNFEGLVAEILENKGFGVIKNLILKKPRREIDVVGINLGVAILIDCKHWTKTRSSSLYKVVEKQVERTKQYISQTQGAIAVPVIVTLYQDKVDFINKVPIVPILQFSSFVDEFYGNLDQMKKIKAS